MARSIHLRRWWALVAIIGIALVGGYVWWAGRVSRAVARVMMDSGRVVEVRARLPKEMVPAVTREMIRDYTLLESWATWLEARLPRGAFPASLRPETKPDRQGRMAAALKFGRGEEEMLGACEAAIPDADPESAAWLLQRHGVEAPHGHPSRARLFLAATLHPDAGVRANGCRLVLWLPQSQFTPEIQARLRLLLEDRVLIVREEAKRALGLPHPETFP